MNKLSDSHMFVANKSREGSVVVKGVVPSSLRLQFKIICTQQELKMSEVIENLIERWIQADEPIPQFTTTPSDEDLVEVKGYVPRALKHRFRVLCTQKRVPMRWVLYHLINKWVHSGDSDDYSSFPIS